jgi:hypothetical protein
MTTGARATSTASPFPAPGRGAATDRPQWRLLRVRAEVAPTFGANFLQANVNARDIRRHFYTSAVSNDFPPPLPQDGPEPLGTRPDFGSAPLPPPDDGRQEHWAFAAPPPPTEYYYEVEGPDDPLVSTDLSSWFSKVFAGMRRSWKSLLIYRLMALVPTVLLRIAIKPVVRPSTGLRSLFGQSPSALAILSSLTGVVVYVVSTTASAHVLAHDAVSEGEGSSSRTGWWQGLRFGFLRFWPMLGWSVASCLSIYLGMLFCVLPGIYLEVIFRATFAGVVAFERPSSVIRRCFALMKGHWWEMFGRAFLVSLAAAAVIACVGFVSGGFTLAARRARAASLRSNILLNVINVPFAMFLSVAAVVTYAELRRKLEPVTSAQLAAESALPS